MAETKWQPGEELYSVFHAVLQQLGVDMDPWEVLDKEVQEVWERTAILVGAELSDEAKKLLGDR